MGEKLGPLVQPISARARNKAAQPRRMGRPERGSSKRQDVQHVAEGTPPTTHMHGGEHPKQEEQNRAIREPPSEIFEDTHIPEPFVQSREESDAKPIANLSRDSGMERI
jgi:hypothetical protein